MTGFYVCTPASDVSLRPSASPLYAPELRGRDAAGPDALAAADIWSLGQLLVLLLTGVQEQLLAATRHAIEIGRVTAAVSALVVNSASTVGSSGGGSGSGSDAGGGSNAGGGVGSDAPAGGGVVPRHGGLPAGLCGTGMQEDESPMASDSRGSSLAASVSSLSASLSATPSPPESTCTAQPSGKAPLPAWQHRLGKPTAASPLRNRDELVRTALLTLANLLLQRDPAARPSAADVLSDLGSIQLILP